MKFTSCYYYCKDIFNKSCELNVETVIKKIEKVIKVLDNSYVI